jgi:RimJ/RimL family protein N-acetyltransferase
VSQRLQPHRIELGDAVLRPFLWADEPAVAEALRDPNILRWTAGTAVIRSPADQRAHRWLETRIDGWARGNVVFAIADATSDQVLGSVSVREVNRVPDQAVVAYWVSPAARGRRLAARALDKAARWAFAKDGLGLHRLSPSSMKAHAGSRRGPASSWTAPCASTTSNRPVCGTTRTCTPGWLPTQSISLRARRPVRRWGRRCC